MFGWVGSFLVGANWPQVKVFVVRFRPGVGFGLGLGLGYVCVESELGLGWVGWYVIPEVWLGWLVRIGRQLAPG